MPIIHMRIIYNVKILWIYIHVQWIVKYNATDYDILGSQKLSRKWKILQLKGRLTLDNSK